MHANNDPPGVRSAYPFPEADAAGRPFGVAGRQTDFSSSGRIVILGPIRRKCPEVVVVAVDKIAGRCKQATASAATGLERTPRNPRHEPCDHTEVIVVGLGAVGSAAAGPTRSYSLLRDIRARAFQHRRAPQVRFRRTLWGLRLRLSYRVSPILPPTFPDNR